MYASIELSNWQMERLNDGQGWYKPGDSVSLGGYLPDDDTPNPAFSLDVNGYEHDNWMHWADMPTWLQKRIQEAGKKK